MKFWLLMVGIDLINPLTMIALRKKHLIKPDIDDNSPFV